MRKLAAAFGLMLMAAETFAAPGTIMLIGGRKSEGAARHEYPEGIRILERLLRGSPDVRRLGLKVAAYPEGWPDDPRAFRDAATVVWYFDGFEHHPLRDRKRAQAFGSLVRRGAGIVSLHQASTVVGDALDYDIPAAIGGARLGFPDRLTDIVPLRVAPGGHPIARGLSDFAYYDEFFPTIQFRDRARMTPILRGGDGFIAAWAFERPGGGRAFAFTGAHYLAALDQPEVRRMVLNAILWTAQRTVPAKGVRSGDHDASMRVVRPMLAAIPRTAVRDAAATDTLGFHRDARRTGWNSAAGIAKEDLATFGLRWESAQLAGHAGQPPRLYASPLYMERVGITAGEHRGATTAVVFAATSSADVYAIAAGGGVARGTILWRTRLGEPCTLKPAPLDGVPTGVLSTPVIDPHRGRLYVTSCDEANRWQAFALDIGSGAVLPGWPITLHEGLLNEVNANAGAQRIPPTRRHDFRVQRGALALSHLGRLLHVTFGETETGWIVAIETGTPRTLTAFAASAMPHRGSGGMWGAGGAAIARDEEIYVATGTGYDGYRDQPNDWTQSVLQLGLVEDRYVLRGTYTPFNHCITAKNDIDLGSGGVMLLPDRDWAATATPGLLALGGKQGNVYLVDRLRMDGRGVRRPPCSTDAASDRSLLPPDPQPQFGTRGPLNVFGPYSEQDGAMDIARARSVPAYFEDAAGQGYLFVTGNQKLAAGSAESIPPSLARLAVVTEPGERPWLRVDRAEARTVLLNPGSPLVTSNGHGDAIVWVLDENARRSALLSEPEAPRPVLYAFDAATLALLWRSSPGALATSGKYNEPVFARGMAIVGTDRIQAFGAGGSVEASAANAAAGEPARERAPRSEAARSGQVVYAERCAACHDHPQGSIPPREVLARRSHSHIVEVLTRGAMRPYTQGLDAQEIEAVARYLQ